VVDGCASCEIEAMDRHTSSRPGRWCMLTHAAALGIAVHYSCRESIQLLIEKYGADVNAVSDDVGHTAVSQACAAGDFDTVQLLLSRGGRLHSAIADSLQNPLHEAVAAHDSTLVAQLLRLDAEYCATSSSIIPLLAQQDSSRRTPLFACATASSAVAIEVWEQLLDSSDTAALQRAVRQQNIADRTVLHMLILFKQQLMLQKLLGCSERLGCIADQLLIEDTHGVSPALLAQRIAHTDTLAQLVHYCPEVRVFVGL
jgi:Ankyrin repeats (3 copies)